MPDERTPIVLVAGLAGPTPRTGSAADTGRLPRSGGSRRVPPDEGAGSPVEEVADAFLQLPGTAVVHHDLRRISQGVVRRRVRWGTPPAGGTRPSIRGADPANVVPHTGIPLDRWHVLELAHGCVSCTLREDLLPLTRRLCATPGVERVVLHLDPALEPEALCWALRHVVVDPGNGSVGAAGAEGAEGATVLDHARVEAVVTVVDSGTWLADATGDETLAERGLSASADDDRTVAQVCVGQVEFADALVLAGAAPDAWTGARTGAVLDRLAPTAPRTRLDRLDPAALLAEVPADARRGEVDDAHAPVLRGQPPLDSDCGVSTVVFTARRPFHPERLHDAVDVLLDGVVRARGRMWVASQPDVALWLESAGGGLRVGHAGPWLAALDRANTPDADTRDTDTRDTDTRDGNDPWVGVDPRRRAMAALRWDPYYGDRDQEIVVVAHRADPDEIEAALRHALLTDAELAEGEEVWRGWPDPFGEWHDDPCASAEPHRETDRSPSNPLRNTEEK